MHQLIAVIVLAAASDQCTIEGRLTLLSGAKPARIEPGLEPVVYVADKLAAPRSELPRTHTITQIDRQFSPQVLVVQKGDTVEFVNEDAVRHDVFSRSTDLRLDPSQKRVTGSRMFDHAGPVRAQCNIHGWMRADILVVPTPFASRVSADGSFRIEGLPPGRLELEAWERNGGKATTTVQCKPGVVTIDVTLHEAPRPTLLNRFGQRYVNEYQT